MKTIAASQHYFQLFGANPILGRTFRPEEDRPGGRRVAVLSYGLWQRRFGGDRAVVGKVVTLGDEPHDVIGVLGPGFTSYPPADVWTPLQADPASATQASTLTVVARLPPGTSLAAADARVNAIATRFAREHSSSPAARPDAQVAPLREQVSGEVRPLLVMLLGAVGLVLLVACANVANLLLARAANREQEFAMPRHNFNLFLFGAFAFVATLLAAVGIYGVTAYGVEQRRREIGIRTALGATRGDVFRWALREALAISAAGIGLGLAASLALTRLIEALLFGVEPSDAIALVSAPLIAAAVALAAAAIPALRAGRVDPVAALRAG